MANENELFDTDLSGIGMPPEGEGDIDLTAALAGNITNEGESGDDGEDTSQGKQGNDGNDDPDALDLEAILKGNEEGSDNNGNDEDGDGAEYEDTPGVGANNGTPNDHSSSQDNEGASPLLTPFASLLHDEGVLPHLNIEEISKLESQEEVIEALIEGVKAEINTANNSFKEELPKEFHDLVDAYEQGVPFDFLMRAKQAQLSYDSIDDEKLESDTELQKKLVTDLMTAKGLKESRIKKLIERSEDLGELYDDAKEAKEELAEAYKAQIKQAQEYEKQQRAAAEKSYKEFVTSLKDTISSTDEIIPGMKVNKNIKDSTFKHMTEPVGVDENGNPINFIMHKRAESKNPTLFDIRLNYLVEITDGLKDFSKINAVAESSAAKKFLKNLDSNTSFKPGKPKNPKTSEGGDYMNKLLKSI